MIRETVAAKQAALDAYWAAKTPDQERSAYKQMMTLGMSHSYDEETRRAGAPSMRRAAPSNQYDPIKPNRLIVETWRLFAQLAIESNKIRPGEFNWPCAILSLIPEWEKNNVE